MTADYDAIVVGARCAGSPTAMLLARLGHRVLLVDRDAFPSDTLSTLIVHAPGVAALRRWGLLDEVVATGCPPVTSYAFDFGPVTLRGTPPPVDGISTGFAPRRTVLDKILLDAAARAGAEVRERFNVDELLVEDGAVVGIRGHSRTGTGVVERARVVIGADGRGSRVAKAVAAASYHERPRLQYCYYTFFSGLPVDGMETTIRPHRGWAAIPTHDDLTLVVQGWPITERAAFKADVAGGFHRTFELAPGFAERVRAAKREAPFLGGALRGYFRTPYGPGWALVGDAGYNKDPITGQGISDAFRDAGLCATAVHEALTGTRPYDEAMAHYQRARDQHVLPMYELTSQLATLEPPPPEMQRLLAAVAGDQRAVDDFVGVNAGTVSPAEFFAPENVARILAAARMPAA
jgi:2-polyprenyl-6-methoxyphenol hydroxylase-like FAD-dependent oxidoreductase